MKQGIFTGRGAGFLLWAERQLCPTGEMSALIPAFSPRRRGMVRPVVEGLEDQGGRMIARKSGRGLPHYRTLRADACLPAKEGWWTLGAPADGQSARQRTASPRHVAGRGS